MVPLTYRSTRCLLLARHVNHRPQVHLTLHFSCRHGLSLLRYGFLKQRNARGKNGCVWGYSSDKRQEELKQNESE